jgi:hypothetical protein
MEQTTVVAGAQPVRTPTFAPAVRLLTGTDGQEVVCHEREVPSFAGVELERLYQNPYATLVKFAIDGTIADAGSYLVQQNGQIKTLFLFRIENRRLVVLNEVVRIDSAEAQRFVESIFARFSHVDVILFRTIHTDIRQLDFPFQRFNHSEDIVIPLPGSEQAYRSCLSQTVRRNLKYYGNRLQREHPSFSVAIYEKEQVSEQHIHDIIGLSRARMAGKNKIFGIEQKETECILGLVKAYGLVTVATVDGKVCGGTICYQVGSHYFMGVIAHDPAYDSYRLGTQCAYRTICECISREGREFHFLWGEMDYKYRLLGVKRELDHVAVYRSRSQMLWHAGTALQVAYCGYLRRLKLWLHADNKEFRQINQFLLKSFEAVRTWMRK